MSMMCHFSCRAQRKSPRHPLLFWRFNDARIFGWVDTDSEELARAQAIQELGDRGWEIRNFEFVTVFDPGTKLSSTNAAARASGSHYHVLRWSEPLEDSEEAADLLSIPVITSRYADTEGVTIDPEKIPAALRPLVPYARVWAIGDDEERLAFARRQSSEDKRAFVEAVRPLFDELEAWCASRRSEAPVPDEVVLFDMMAEAYAELE